MKPTCKIEEFWLLQEKEFAKNTWDFSMVAFSLSHMGLMSMLDSRSRSPCRKNSSMIKSTQCRYSSNGLVGFDKSAQWTIFCKTCKKAYKSASLLDWASVLEKNYLYAVSVVVEQKNSGTSHFFGFDHRLQVCQKTHVLWHVSGQNLQNKNV